MKRISLFLSCLFAAVSVFAGNLSGLLNKVGVEYDFDYVFVTNIADNSVKMEGTLNAEALAVEGLAVQVMVDGKVAGDATVIGDAVSYRFDGSYAQGDVIQANLLFKYNAGQTVTSGINYVVAYETPFNVTVPEGSEACYLVFAEEGLEKAVEMDWVSLNAFTTVVPFNAMGKEYYYSLKTEENFYEVDAEGTAVMRTYKGEADVVVAWNQLCAPYYELVVNDSVVVELKFEGDSYCAYDLALEEGNTLQIREYTKACLDTITNIIAGGDEPLPYKLIEEHLALMQLDGIYNVVFNPETRELKLNRHNGNMMCLYKNYLGSDIKAKPYAGFNAAAEKVVVDEMVNDYYLKITTGGSKTAVAGLVGNAYGVSFMKQVIENPSALVFDYKANMEGRFTISIVKTDDDPATALPVFAYGSYEGKTDDWKTVVIYLDENLEDKSVLSQENEGDSYYILFNIAGDKGLEGGELDIRDMYFAPYIKYNVTVPEGTEECYLKNEAGFAQMVNDAPNHYSLEFYDSDRYSQTYNYYAGYGEEFVEADATGADVAPRYYHAEDVVAAWKSAYCSPKFGYLMNDQLIQLAETDGGNLVLEKIAIAEEDSAYYIINMCTEDTMKAAEVPAIAGDYKVELVLADTSVIFTKIEPVDPDPDEKEYLCNMIWSGEVALGGWTGSVGDLSWGGYDWSTAKSGDKLTIYFTVDESVGYTNLRFGDGSWKGLPTTLADPATDPDGNYSGFAADATSKSIILSQADIEVLVNQGGLVICGAGLVIKGIELCREADIECNTIWFGDVALGGWTGSVGALSWGGYDWSTVKQGSKLTVRFTVDESVGYTNLRFGNGNWAALPTTLADPATDPDGNYSGFAADATYKTIVLSAADLADLNNNGGLVICGAGLNIKEIELCEVVDLICNNLWEGDVALGGWTGSVGDLSWGGYDWSTANIGDKLTVYFTVDESVGYTNLRFGDGSWKGLPTTLADPATDPDGNYSGFAADATSKSFRLSAEDIDALVNQGGLVICGAGLNIKAIELCHATIMDCNNAWEGDVALGGWTGSVGDLSWGGYDWSVVPVGSRLTVTFTVDESVGYTNLRFGDGSWTALPTTLADPATDPDGNYSGFAADATSKGFRLSAEDIDALVNQGGLVICGAGLNIKSIEICSPHQDGPTEECFEIVDEAFNALDENASIAEGVMTFAAANSAMNMWLGGLDLSALNTLTIEYEATTDFQVLLQDAQGEEQFVASADTNIVVYHYLANVDMAKLMQFIFVAQEAGTVKLNSLCFSQVEYPTYYLGNKWDGAEEVSFRQMSTDNHGDWTVTGVLGSDEVLLAFAAEPTETVSYKISEIAEVSGKDVLVGDEVEFHCYEFLGNAFTAEVLARPTYVKHPWESGEWIWAAMTRNEALHQWEYVGVWGGQGFNINAAGPYDNEALWFAANSEDVVYITVDGELTTEPAIGTKVTICYQDNDTQAGVRYEAATGLNFVKDGIQAVKVLENGQMFIIRDGKTYNIVGACVRNK